MKDESDRSYQLLKAKVDLLEQYQQEMLKMMLNDSSSLKKHRIKKSIKNKILDFVRPFDQKLRNYPRYSQFKRWLYQKLQ